MGALVVQVKYEMTVGPVGCAVTPTIRTRLVACSM